jgi:hypothetical protein
LSERRFPPPWSVEETDPPARQTYVHVGSAGENPIMSDVDDKKDFEIARLRELVKSLADELESAIEAQYDRVKNYPSMKRGYDRDMATVRQALRLFRG